MTTDFSAPNSIEELTEQFLRRRRAGESPTMEEYIEEHPELAGEIRDVFPALMLIENVRADVAADPTCAGVTELSSHVGETIGDYRLLREIGRGGMGIVYEANQESLGRRVAIKLLTPELIRSPKYLQRFKREARAAANLQHTNIVPVFGVGEDDGLHYYVMQHIHGRGIDEVMDALHRLPDRDPASPHETSATDLAEVLGTGRMTQSPERSDQRADLGDDVTDQPSNASTWRSSATGRSYFKRVAEIGSQAADALAYAHRRGVLHRDIKPSNLLLDLTGNVWITDFGLAKIEGDDDITATGDVVGTLSYIAPESLRGEFDARGDIYGLGLTLYEMIARKRAFDSNNRGELVRRISCEGPPRLSRQSGIPRDLQTIICKALQRDPKDRYSSAHALADDLNRFLRDEPVLARRTSAPARLVRWARRNRALAAVSTLLLSGLFIALATSLFVSNQLHRLTNELSTSLHNSRQLNYVGDVGFAYQAIRNGDVGRGRTLLLNHVPEPGEDHDDLRGFEWRYLWSRTQGNYTSDLGTYRGFLSGLAVSPNGQFLARSKTEPARVEIIRVSSSEVERTIDVPSIADSLIYTSSGDLLIGTFHGELMAWDTQTWERRGTTELRSPIAVGRRKDRDILVGCDNGNLVMWDVNDWQEVATLPSRPSLGPLRHGYGTRIHTFSCLAISGDGRFLFFAGASGIRRWDLDRRVELEPFRVARWRHLSPTSGFDGGEGASSIATSSDGQLAVGDRRGNVRLMDPRTGRVLHLFESHVGWVSALKFTANGTRLISAGGDRKVILYDPAQRTIVDNLLGHSTQVWGLDASAGGETIAAGSGYGGHLLTWALSDGEPGSIERARISEYAVMADGRLLVHRDGKHDAELYDVHTATYEPMGASRLLGMMIKEGEKPIGVSPDRTWCVSWKGNTLTLWNSKTAQRVRQLTRESDAVAQNASWFAVFSPNSQYLLTSGKTSSVRLWRTEDWSTVDLCPQQSRALGVGFSADSRRLVVGEHHDLVQVFELDGKHPRPLLQLDSKDFSGHSQNVFSAALSSAGRYVAVGLGDGVTRVWDLDTSEMVASLEGHVSGVASLSFSPDDRTLASSSHSGSMILWHVPTWRQLMNVPAEVDNIRFSPDGTYLVAIVRHGDAMDFPGDGPGLRIWKAPKLSAIDVLQK